MRRRGCRRSADGEMAPARRPPRSPRSPALFLNRLLVALRNTGVDPRGQLAGGRLLAARRSGWSEGAHSSREHDGHCQRVSAVAFAGMSSAVPAASAGQSRRLPRAVQQIQGSAAPPGSAFPGQGKGSAGPVLRAGRAAALLAVSGGPLAQCGRLGPQLGGLFLQLQDAPDAGPGSARRRSAAKPRSIQVTSSDHSQASPGNFPERAAGRAAGPCQRTRSTKLWGPAPDWGVPLAVPRTTWRPGGAARSSGRGPGDSFRGRAGSSRWRMPPAGSAADYLRLEHPKICSRWSRHSVVAWV
jgi:hypothetical protein